MSVRHYRKPPAAMAAGLAHGLTGGFDLRRVPWALLGAVVLLSLVGALFIVSAKSVPDAKKHLMFASVGIVAFFLVAIVDYRHLASLSAPLYLAGVLSLVLLMKFGATWNEAKRWFDLGPISVQPSEPMKYVMVIIVATYFTCRRRLDRLRDLAVPLALTAAPMLLIVRQPDLGSAILLLPSFFVIAFVAGVPLRNLILLILAGAMLALAAWVTPGALKDYQKDRLISFIDPERDPDSMASYNTTQVAIAVTGGGATGRGWGKGRLNRLGAIPERDTDFIFPVIAEEWGFFRTAGLVGFYMLVMALLARIVCGAQDRFGRLLSAGVLTVFGFQSLLHMAIALRLAPITGLTLPLVSRGGSSLISTFAGLGLAASVAARSRRVFLVGERDT